MSKTVSRLLLAFAGIALSAVLVHSDARTAQYKTSAVCMMCHKNTNKGIVEAYQRSPHARAMQKADVPGAVVGDFSTNTAFEKGKVAYVLGTGRHKQAYLDAGYKVLPAEWDVQTKSWKAVQSVDGTTQCIGCHTTGYVPSEKKYAQMGVGCESCHGPGSEHMAAKDRKASIVNPANLDGAKRAMVCGQCHSSGHNAALNGGAGEMPFTADYRPGDDLAKNLVDSNPTAPGRNQQYSEFVRSKHAKMGLSCTTCHDPHNTTGNEAQLKQPVTEQCLSCHAAKIKDIASHAPSAPAGATCATCHMPNGQHTFAEPGG
ncbi:MAG: multiheme c-type cytochrome [Armatimonadota bacterium]